MTNAPSGETLWIDPSYWTRPARPWRKIHLDFHNSKHMPCVGEAFDPTAFVETLRRAHVNAITVFAKDMHGYFYYPSAFGPVHPGLQRDLLGEQVAACRAHGIRVYAYYCTTWDNYLAEHHPEWLVWKRDGTTYLPRFDEPPGWTALCLSNEDFVQLMLEHSREMLERYRVDGLWYDMPMPRGGECFCPRCLAALRAADQSPFNDGAQREHKQQLLTAFLQRSADLAHAIRPGCQVDQNNQTQLGLPERARFLDNIDIEALPTGGWGYLYFPVNVRYARTVGVSTCGQTGRFQRSWADFGGLKHPTQLRLELAGIVAQGAQCCIGDQPSPSGRLDAAVYSTIDQAYAEIERLEPYLERAAPVVEAALLVAGLPLTDVGRPTTPLGRSVLGATKLLIEQRIQFDVVEADSPFERYRLLVLPDWLTVDAPLADRLNHFLTAGGSVLSLGRSLCHVDSNRSWLTGLGLAFVGESPYQPCYLCIHSDTALDLPPFEYALYAGADYWEGHNAGATVLARLGEPLFQRSGEHYTSHVQTPFDHETDYPAVIQRDRFAAVAFPLATSYYQYGYWVYRQLFRQLIRTIYPHQLLQSSAPSSAELSLTYQPRQREQASRYLLHAVNYSPAPRPGEHPLYFEDPTPLPRCTVDLHLAASLTRARDVTTGQPCLLEQIANGWRLHLPPISINTLVALEDDALLG